MQKRNPYQTLIVIFLGLIVLSIILKQDEILYVGLGIALIGLLSKNLCEWIDRAWFGLAEILGRISSSILLSMIFVFILTPIAFLSKMNRNRNKSFYRKIYDKSFYINNHKEYSPNDFEKMW